MQKKDWIKLLEYVFIGVVAAGIAGWCLYRNQLKFKQEQAHDAFCVAMHGELLKWSGVDVYFYSSGNRRLTNDSTAIKKESIKVSLESDECGLKDYLIPYEKYSHNITWNSDELSGIYSYLLHTFPLNADSLNFYWQEQLARIGLSGTTIVRISVADWLEHESYTYSADSLYLSKADSLFTYYLGARCEVGVTGCFYTPWWMAFSWKEWVLLAALMFLGILLFFVRDYVHRIYCLLFVKKERQTMVVKNHSHIYPLEKGVYFDATFRVLKRGDVVVSLTPLLAQLLQGFLEAEEHKLSHSEIQQLLWPGNSSTSDNVYQSVKRLRDYLSKLSVCTIECKSSVYWLKIPHLIEKKSYLDTVWDIIRRYLTQSDIV